MILSHFLASDAFWIGWAVRVATSVTLIWFAVTIAVIFLRAASAAVRHRLWSLSVVAALALPALVMALPELRAGWIDLRTSSHATHEVPMTATGMSAAIPPAVPYLQRADDKSLVAPSTKLAPPRAVLPASVGGANRASARTAVSRRVALGLFLFWAAPVVAALAWTARSLRVARRLVREAAIIDDEHCREALRRLLAHGNTRDEVELRESDATCSPLCVGWLRATIILPCDWRDWPPDHLVAVLAHELAHVVRHDVGWQLLARMGAAIYWFH